MIGTIDHAALAVRRLLGHFRDKPNMSGFVRAIGAQANEVEQALADIVAISIDTATGAVLDAEGTLVREARRGRSDTDYRAAIRARIRILKGHARIEDLLYVLAAALGVTHTIELSEPYAATVHADVTTGLTGGDASPDVLAGLLDAAAGGGIKHALMWGTVDATSRLTFAPGDVQTADALRGWANDTQTAGGFFADVAV